MKRYLIIPAAALLAAASQAAIIASDSFETSGTDAYSTTSRLHGQSPTDGTVGFSGDTAWGGAFATGDIDVSAAGLTAGLAVGASGGSAVTDGGDTDRNVYRTFDSFSAAADTTYYYSFLFSVGTGATAGTRSAFGITTATAGNGPDPVDGVMIGVDAGSSITGGDLSLWVGGNEVSFSGGYTAGETYFALVQIDNADGNDTVTANIFSASATDMSVSLAAASTSAYDISDELLGIEIQKDSTGNNTYYDEFYFGTALSDVSAVPEPGSVALLCGGAFLLLGARRFRM